MRRTFGLAMWVVAAGAIGAVPASAQERDTMDIARLQAQVEAITRAQLVEPGVVGALRRLGEADGPEGQVNHGHSGAGRREAA